MRTREEIEEKFLDVSSRMFGEIGIGIDQRKLMLEVLLDIRELLLRSK